MKNKAIYFFLVIMAVTSSCIEEIPLLSDSTKNLADFEAVWNRINTVYPYLEFKNVNWDSIHTVYNPRFERSTGDDFYLIMSEMLYSLHDGHIWFATENGSKLYPYIPRRITKDRESYSPFLVRKYFDKKLLISESTSIEYQILPGNIGYAFLSNFGESYLTFEFPGVLEYLKNTDGLILDLRHNRGGNRHNIDNVISRFLTEPLKRFDVYRLGVLLEPSFIEPSGSFTYSKPVVVLTNGVTFSAGEGFTELMKQLPNVTVVGDTTGGGSGGSDEISSESRGEFKLPSGRIIYVTTSDQRRFDGLPWEDLGIIPDIIIEQDKSDIDYGRDKQIEYAINILK